MLDDDNFRVVDNMKSLDQSHVQGRMITTTQNIGICFTVIMESSNTSHKRPGGVATLH